MFHRTFDSVCQLQLALDVLFGKGIIWIDVDIETLSVTWEV